MGDLLSTLTASAEDIAAIQSNFNKFNQSRSTRQQQIPESRTSTQETSDPPTNSKTAGTHENPVETKNLIGKQPEESVNDGKGDAEAEEEGEEAGECGFCLFMKAGGCKEAFIEWENCVEAAEKEEDNVVEKCFQATSALKKCMEANSDYYAPILQAEKSMEEEAVKKLEEEKEKEEEKLSGEGGGSSPESSEKEKEGALGGNDSKNQSLIS